MLVFKILFVFMLTTDRERKIRGRLATLLPTKDTRNCYVT